MWSQYFRPLYSTSVSAAQHNNRPVMNIIASARRISPLPEIIRANKVKRIKDTGREWENETQGMSDGIYTLTVTWSPLITFIMWAFSNPVNDSLHWKASKPDEISPSITGERVLKGISSCSRALCCHTGVSQLMGYAWLFLEHFQKHHLQFSQLDMNFQGISESRRQGNVRPLQ